MSSSRAAPTGSTSTSSRCRPRSERSSRCSCASSGAVLDAATLKAGRPSMQITFDITASVDDYDIPALTADDAADAAFLMAYEFRGPNADYAASHSPLDDPETGFDIRTTVAELLAVADPAHTILGLPWYGHAWTTRGPEPFSPTRRGDRLTPPSNSLYRDAIGIARENGRYYDPVAQTAWTTYVLKKPGCSGCPEAWRQVWYDDVDGFAAKIAFAQEQGMRGVGMWALGYTGAYRGMWTVLALASGALVDTTAPVGRGVDRGRRLGQGTGAARGQGERDAAVPRPRRAGRLAARLRARGQRRDARRGWRTRERQHVAGHRRGRVVDRGWTGGDPAQGAPGAHARAERSAPAAECVSRRRVIGRARSVGRAPGHLGAGPPDVGEHRVSPRRARHRRSSPCPQRARRRSRRPAASSSSGVTWRATGPRPLPSTCGTRRKDSVLPEPTSSPTPEPTASREPVPSAAPSSSPGSVAPTLMSPSAPSVVPESPVAP